MNPLSILISIPFQYSVMKQDPIQSHNQKHKSIVDLERAIKKLALALHAPISITSEKYSVVSKPQGISYFKLIENQFVPVPGKLLGDEERINLLMDLGRELLTIARRNKQLQNHKN